MASLRSLPREDVAVAAVLVVYALAEGIAIGAPAGWLVVAPAVCAALAWRRRRPAGVIALVLALIVAPGLVGAAELGTVLPLPLIIVAGYTAGREARRGRTAALGAAAIAAVLAAGLGTTAAAAENPTSADFVALLVRVGATAGAGRVMRVRQAENRQLQALTAQLAAERDLRARAAVTEERARVARELHDVVAHSVSLIAIQAGAAEELMGRDDARARESLRAVQETARGALGEMRRLLTVLREDGEPPGLAPQPGLGSVAELVAEARSGGLPVALREDGARPVLPTGLDLSAYRIVQEALTNVRKHAGAVPTEVLLRYEPRGVVVEVSNADGRDGVPPPDASAPPGHGIAGMRERARLYGGTLRTGRRDGRYVVSAHLPLAQAAE